MITIVIPVYRHWELAHQLLFDIYQNLPSDTQIVVADDCSNDEAVVDGLKWWKKKMLKDRLTLAANKTNVGFLRTCNRAVKAANTENVVLVSTDVRIQDKTFAQKIENALNVEDKYILAGTKLYEQSTGWNEMDGKIFPYLEGWLLAFRKSEWSELGGFDTIYAPNDFEDVDISTTYLNKGGKLVYVEANVTHLGAGTMGYTPERRKITEINKEKFREKWLN